MKGLRQECERHEIPQPTEMTIEMVHEGIAQCTDELDELCPVAYPKRKEHLTIQLRRARVEERDKNVCAIKQIILLEESLNTWGRLSIATRRPRSAAASRCSVLDENGQTVIISGAEPFNEAVKKNIGSQYQGATDAPIFKGNSNWISAS